MAKEQLCEHHWLAAAAGIEICGRCGLLRSFRPKWFTGGKPISAIRPSRTIEGGFWAERQQEIVASWR